MRIFSPITILAALILLAAGCGAPGAAAGVPSATQGPDLAATNTSFVTASVSLMPAETLTTTAPETAIPAGTGGLADCPVTRPPEPAFVPPEPWPAKPPGEDQFWYGEAGLWTALPESGSWRQLALGEKFWWWSQEFDVKEDSTPDLTVTARRLDTAASNYRNEGATNGFHESFNWAMLQGVQLPSAGCWEFTGEYKGQQLSFVLWVPPE